MPSGSARNIPGSPALLHALLKKSLVTQCDAGLCNMVKEAALLLADDVAQRPGEPNGALNRTGRKALEKEADWLASLSGSALVRANLTCLFEDEN